MEDVLIPSQAVNIGQRIDCPTRFKYGDRYGCVAFSFLTHVPLTEPVPIETLDFRDLSHNPEGWGELNLVVRRE